MSWRSRLGDLNVADRKVQLAIAGAAVGCAAAVALYLRSRAQTGELAPPIPAADTAASDPAPAVTAPVEPGSSAPPESGAGAPKSTDEGRKEDALKAKQRGNKRFAGQQYKQAIDEYTRALDLHPDPKHEDVAVFLSNRAQCYASLDDHAHAERDCDAALAINPKYVKALCRRGLAREKLGKASPALEDFMGACLLSNFGNDVAKMGTERSLKAIARVKAEQRLQAPTPLPPHTSPPPPAAPPTTATARRSRCATFRRPASSRLSSTRSKHTATSSPDRARPPPTRARASTARPARRERRFSPSARCPT